jgi:SNF2 family DNA or RNA helicase
MDKWNAGQVDILIAHPASAGHGLNLQFGGSSVIWFGLTWSNELNAQFNARLYRQGQTKTVVVSYLAAEGTIDEVIMEAVGAKHDSQEILLNALRRRVAELAP